MKNTFDNYPDWNSNDFSEEEMTGKYESIEEITSETTSQTYPETSASEELPPVKRDEDIEHLLNSFSDILQTEIHQVADELYDRLTQSTQQTTQMVRLAANELAKNFAKVIEQQEITIQKQHQSTTKFQEDVLYKVQKNLIMELIEIADNIRMMLQDQKKERDYDTLLESVKSLEEWVNATLSNNSVRSYRDTDECPTTLNRKRQEVVDTETTNNPALNNVYVSERPGYIWTMPYLVVNSDVQLQNILKDNERPQTFSFVIRPEEVIKLKYNGEKINDNTII